MMLATSHEFFDKHDYLYLNQAALSSGHAFKFAELRKNLQRLNA